MNIYSVLVREEKCKNRDFLFYFKFLPQEAEGGLEEAREEGGSEAELEKQYRILHRRNLLPQHRPEY